MARSFPGSGTNYLGGSGSLNNIGGTALTVSAWVRPAATADMTVVAKWRYFGVRQYALGLKGTRVLDVAIKGATIDALTGVASAALNAWNHVAMVKNGTGAGALAGFLNGTKDVSGTSNVSISTSVEPFCVGIQNTDLDNRWNGSIAEVAIWNAALTDAEIAALAKGTSPLQVHPANLKGYYPLWGVGATGDPDLSGNAGHLTETGTVGVVDHAPVQPYVLL